MIIQGNDFVQGSITINVNDSVRWLHRDGTTPHTVDADDGSFSSGGAPYMTEVPTRDTYTLQFGSPGAYPYHCQIHPAMTDTITVV